MSPKPEPNLAPVSEKFSGCAGVLVESAQIILIERQFCEQALDEHLASAPAGIVAAIAVLHALGSDWILEDIRVMNPK